MMKNILESHLTYIAYGWEGSGVNVNVHDRVASQYNEQA